MSTSQCVKQLWETNVQDGWTIDQHIDFDGHRKQLNLSCPMQASTFMTHTPATPHTRKQTSCTISKPIDGRLS